MEDPIKLSDRLFERLTGSHDTPGRPPAPDADADVVGLDPELQAFVRNLRDKDYIDCQLKAMDRFDVDAAWQAVGELVDSEGVIPPMSQSAHIVVSTSAAGADGCRWQP